MIRSKFVVIASVLMLLFVTGCNQDEAAEENPTPTPVAVKKKAKKAAAGAKAKEGETADKTATAPAKAGKPKPKAAAPAGNTAGAKQTLAKLSGYLPAAVKALETDDVDTAKLYIKGFTDNWQQQGIQSIVKKASPDSFKKISAGVTQVNNLMKAEAPDKAKAKAAIQSLSQAVLEYAK